MEKDDHRVPPVSASQLKEKRRGRRRRGEEGRKEKKRNYFKPAHKKPWLGCQGLEMLGAEVQLGAPHPHTLLPDCPDTEAAGARSLLLDKYTQV